MTLHSLPSRSTARRRARLFLLCAVLAVGGTSAVAAEEPASPAISFAIKRFEVEGGTLLPASNIDALLLPYTGEHRGFADVEHAVQALREAYQKQGYKLVEVVLPEQELTDGIVRLRVVETRIGKVIVEGNDAFSMANIRHSLPGLREGEVPDLDRVSASLKLANENPAKKTTLQLASGDKPDEVDATVKVADEKPWRVGLTVDNTGNSQTGETRVGLNYQHANVFGLDHVASLFYTTSPGQTDNVSIYGAGYHIPLYALGDSIDLYGAHSNVDAGTVSAGALSLQVSGKGEAYGARYNQSLGTWRAVESKLMYSADYRVYDDEVTFVGIPLGNQVIVHPVGLTYAGRWAGMSNDFGGYVGGFFNVPGGSHGEDADFELVRSG